ncbi:MAG: hypothetical protein OSA99_04130 [Acidimicrobiales bacterium]|nr:hypothetical protein [Acidimicrobiales bacterium]
MSTDLTYQASIPPQGTKPVYKRLWRGYGPLAILALALMLMAALVPTMSEERPAGGADTGTDGTESGLVVDPLEGGTY